MKDLIQKYNVPGPRYTSYPTVPFWQKDQICETVWFNSIEKNIQFFGSNEVSIYIHLPYCESLCTFCGCHKRITKNHEKEQPYIDSLIQEWELYSTKFNLKIKEIHLGGGTPTFFSPSELKRLIDALLLNQKQELNDVSFSFEAHPNNTSLEHLTTLFNIGFKRLSFGIQDYDSTVQKAIIRIQSFEQVKLCHTNAKNVGYSSISHDLVYGLPLQTLAGFENSINLTLSLKPQRVSLYSYAHVPWIKGNGQRGFDENDLPSNENKRALYEMAKTKFLANGYIEIGMDHFALKDDELAIAFTKGELHRNFMGYTTQSTKLLIGLGCSSISDSWFAFSQNEKNVENYQEIVKKKVLPLTKGHVLSEKDLILRKCILDLMCHFQTDFPIDFKLTKYIISKLGPIIKDDLIEIKNNKLIVKEIGIPFLRNICMAFDAYLDGNTSSKPIFSKTI